MAIFPGWYEVKKFYIVVPYLLYPIRLRLRMVFMVQEPQLWHRQRAASLLFD
jgi:hypothetical protein